MELKNTLISFTVGSTLMYYLDPDKGHRRRALLQDQLKHSSNVVNEAVNATAEDFVNRAKGISALMKAKILRQEIPDTVLLERIRSRLGRVTSHVHALDISVSNGTITLSGPVLKSEEERIISNAGSVTGVRGVINKLEVHTFSENIPALQAAARRAGFRFEYLQTRWMPAPRFIAGVAGGGLMIAGMRQKGIAGSILSAAGSLLFLRGLTNIELKHLIGLGAGYRAVDIQKTVNFEVPVEQVFDLLSRYEQFPQFVEHVLESKNTGGDRSRWIIIGPLGLRVRWDAVTTKFEPNKVIAWKTLPESTVAHTGVVQFEKVTDQSSRIDIKLSYNPPAGAIGHAIISAAGWDPRHLLDEELIRIKSLLEAGVTRAKGLHVSKEEIMGAQPPAREAPGPVEATP